MDKSRTTYTKRNITISTAAQIVSIVFSFISRTIFIMLMNVDYLGINGLFSNILSILSFSEMGLSTAIIYNMYKPAAMNDYQKLGELLNFYKKAYRWIAAFILVVGFCFIPFLNSIISSPPNIYEDLKIIYLLFLLQTVSSYIFSYNRSLFTVYQVEYKNIVIERGVWILSFLLQLLYLYLTHDFYGYIIMQIIATLTADLIITYLAKKKYKDVYEYARCQLSKMEVKKIYNDVSSLFLYKIGTTILHSTDNLIISKILNLTVVGICSNYILITSSLETILLKSLNSLTASLGNLNATDDAKSKLKVLSELTLATNWIYGTVSICMFVGISEFINLWLGKSYVLADWKIPFSLVLAFFVFGSNFAASNFRLTMGFFKQSRMVPFAAAIINLVLSILLGIKLGLWGIYLSTAIARILTFNLVDPYLVFNKGLQLSPLQYYLKQTLFLVVTFFGGYSCYVLGALLPNGLLYFMLKVVLAFFIANIIYIIVYFKTDSFKGLVSRIFKK